MATTNVATFVSCSDAGVGVTTTAPTSGAGSFSPISAGAGFAAYSVITVYHSTGFTGRYLPSSSAISYLYVSPDNKLHVLGGFTPATATITLNYSGMTSGTGIASVYKSFLNTDPSNPVAVTSTASLLPIAQVISSLSLNFQGAATGTSMGAMQCVAVTASASTGRPSVGRLTSTAAYFSDQSDLFYTGVGSTAMVTADATNASITLAAYPIGGGQLPGGDVDQVGFSLLGLSTSPATAAAIITVNPLNPIPFQPTLSLVPSVEVGGTTATTSARVQVGYSTPQGDNASSGAFNGYGMLFRRRNLATGIVEYSDCLFQSPTVGNMVPNAGMKQDFALWKILSGVTGTFSRVASYANSRDALRVVASGAAPTISLGPFPILANSSTFSFGVPASASTTGRTLTPSISFLTPAGAGVGSTLVGSAAALGTGATAVLFVNQAIPATAGWMFITLTGAGFAASDTLTVGVPMVNSGTTLNAYTDEDSASQMTFTTNGRFVPSGGTLLPGWNGASRSASGVAAQGGSWTPHINTPVVNTNVGVPARVGAGISGVLSLQPLLSSMGSWASAKYSLAVAVNNGYGWSSWSQELVIDVTAQPSVSISSASTQNTGVPTISWSFTDTDNDAQAAYRLLITSGGSTILDTGVVAGTNARSVVVGPAVAGGFGCQPLPNGTYSITLTTYQATSRQGVYYASNNATQTLTISATTTSTGLTSVVATPNPTQGTVGITLTPSAYGSPSVAMYLQRSVDAGLTWTNVRGASSLAGITAGSITVIDREAPTSVSLLYRALVYSTGSDFRACSFTTTSAVALITTSWWLSEPISQTITNVYNGDEKLELDATEQQTSDIALGNAYPIVMTDSASGSAQTGQITFTFPSDALFTAFETMRLLKQPVLIRSPYGDSVWVRFNNRKASYPLVPNRKGSGALMKQATVTFTQVATPVAA